MGNCCSQDYYNKHKPQVFEMHIVEFSKTYKPLNFPGNLAFTHDPTLFRMTNNANRQPVILKRLDFYSETDLTRFLKRLDKIMLLEHDSLLKIYHYAVEKNQLKDFTVCFTLNIALESFEHTLQDELLFRTKSNQTFTEKEIRAYLNSLVDLLEFLQLQNVSPESLKPSKIYISSNKQPKLLFIGDTSDSISLDNYPQNLSYTGTHASSHFINQSTLPDKTTNGSPAPLNPFKSNILALGLIILDMMSVNNISLLNNPNKSIREQYKVLETNQSFGNSLLSLVKTIITSDEQGRPDPLEFKKIMLMEEYIDTTVSRRSMKKIKAANIEEPNSTNILDSSRLDDKIEPPLRIHLDSCDVTGLNLLEGMGAEYAGKREGEFDTPKIKLEDLRHDLTPTKSDSDGINTGRDGSSKNHEAIEDILRTLDDADEQIDNDMEIEILSVNDLLDFYNKNMTNLKKLTISLQGIVFYKEIATKLGEIIGKQSSLSEIILELPQAEIDEEDLETIYIGIDKLNNLRICYIDFRKVKMTDKSLQALGECLITKTHLVDLTINISDSTISEQDCQEISQWFKKFKNLKSLALNLGGNKAGNAGTELLGKEFVHMKKLETIMIFLYENDIKGNEGITAVFKSLRKLDKLKKISINLVDNYLEDSDMKIIQDFAKHSHVEEISINLNDNCLSEEFIVRLESEFANKQNVNIKV